MNSSSSILVIETESGKLFDRLQGMNLDYPIHKVGFPGAKDFLRVKPPSLVLLNPASQEGEARNLLKTHSPLLPETVWAVSSESITTEALVDFVRLGAVDYLKQPFQEKEFSEFLDRIDWSQGVRHEEPKKNPCQLISFFSYKGGVGTSFLAANLSVALALHGRGRVLVVDFVLQHGNVAEFLNVEPSFTVLDLVQNAERLDEKFLENSIPKHRSGLFVLARPKHPEESELLSKQALEPVLPSLKQAFDYILVDGGSELTGASIACLDASDWVFLVTTPDLASLAGTQRALQTFQKLGLAPEKIKLILNRWHMKGEIESDLIEKHLTRPFAHKFIEDPLTALSSVNRGVPVLEAAKQSKLAASFQAWAREQAVVRPLQGAAHGAA